MKYVLAPLAGFTDAPFRRMCFEGGADLAYTEMVSAAGLAHGSSPTQHLLETMPGEGPVACQIFGATESDIAYATDLIEKKSFHCSTSTSAFDSFKFTELNLNAGCPMTKVTREGSGAKLVEDSLSVAGKLGFRIMQFNAVVQENASAIHLYEKEGFKRIGVVPGGFRSKDGEYHSVILFYHEL